METATVVLAAVLAWLMVCVGMSLKVSDFSSAIRNSKAILVGLCSQLLVLPAIGVGLCLLLNLDEDLAAGVLLIVSMPGGVGSNLLAWVARVDTALSTLLTSISNLVALIWAPAIFNLGTLVLFGKEGQGIVLPFWSTIAQLLGMVIFPLILGVLIAAKYPKFSSVFEKRMRAVAVVLLLFVSLFLAWDRLSSVAEQFAVIVAVSLLLNWIGFLGGVSLSRLFRLPKKQRVSIGLETGFQNAAAALVLASLYLTPAASMVPLVYGGIMFVGFFALLPFKRWM